MGLTGANSNYKILLPKVNPLKVPTSAQSELDSYSVDLSYNPNSIVKSITQQQKRDFSEKEISEIVDKYKSGISATKLAVEYGCHKRTVSDLLKRNGVTVCKRKDANLFTYEDLVCLKDEGFTARQIADKYGVADCTIRRYLKQGK